MTKYNHLYVLQGNYGYGQGYEDIYAAPKDPEGYREVQRELDNYRKNEGVATYRIVQKRERKLAHE